MPCPGEGPCSPWDLDLSCCLGPSGNLPDPCILDGDPVPQEVIDSAILAASQFLWRQTGMQFGCCQVTIRPCKKDDCGDCCIPYDGIGYGYGGFPWYPMHLANGDWINVSCPCTDGCSCDKICQIDLPTPVCSVDEVKIDGEVLETDWYKVLDFKKLVRTKSLQPAPGLITLLTAQVGVDVPGDQWCFSPQVDVVNAADPVTPLSPETTCWAPNAANPDFTWLAEESVTITYNDPTGAEGAGVFQINDAIGLTDWELGLPAMVPGESRLSVKRPDGSRLKLTFISGASLSFDGNWDRGAGQIQFRIENLTVQPGGCWPECNNLNLDDTEIGTWSVTVTYGRPVPELLRKAAAIFACELIKMCVGKPCSFPQRVTSISRQGMNATFLDPMEFMQNGLTGIFLVDLAIKTYNPKRLFKRAWVGSPDTLNKWKVETWNDGDPTGPNCS